MEGKEQPLNNSVPLSAWYKSLVRHYSKQNRYIDLLESQYKILKEENKKLKSQLSTATEYGGIRTMHELVLKYKAKNKALVEDFRKFTMAHKKKELDIDTINQMFEMIKENLITEKNENN